MLKWFYGFKKHFSYHYKSHMTIKAVDALEKFIPLKYSNREEKSFSSTHLTRNS